MKITHEFDEVDRDYWREKIEPNLPESEKMTFEEFVHHLVGKAINQELDNFSERGYPSRGVFLKNRLKKVKLQREQDELNGGEN